MAEKINLPPTLFGDEKNHIKQLWSYLYSAAEILNRNIEEAGGGKTVTVAEKSGKSTQDEVASGKFGTFVKETEVTVPSDENGNTQTITIEALLSSLQARALNQTTTETNMNNVTTPGTYWIGVSGKTNLPSALTSGTVTMQVMAGNNIVRQVIWTMKNIYTRRKASGSWSTWAVISGEYES